MTTLTNVKIKGLENAMRDFNKWQGVATIKLDLDTNEAWTDVFTSCNDWIEYHSKNIVTVLSKRNIHQRDKRTSRKELKSLVSQLV